MKGSFAFFTDSMQGLICFISCLVLNLCSKQRAWEYLLEANKKAINISFIFKQIFVHLLIPFALSLGVYFLAVTFICAGWIYLFTCLDLHLTGAHFAQVKAKARKRWGCEENITCKSSKWFGIGFGNLWVAAGTDCSWWELHPSVSAHHPIKVVLDLPRPPQQHDPGPPFKGRIWVFLTSASEGNLHF